jgi:hypothetical protein
MWTKKYNIDIGIHLNITILVRTPRGINKINKRNKNAMKVYILSPILFFIMP